jgi:hypothetical protein
MEVEGLGRKGGTAPEEARLDQRPEDSMPAGVDLTRNMEEPQDIRGNSFTDAVAAQSIVVFVQLRMRMFELVMALALSPDMWVLPSIEPANEPGTTERVHSGSKHCPQVDN